jgi:RNA polymerase sigma factor (sigma-70 family)
MPRPVTDIWSAVLDGSPSAWEELVRCYAPLVFTVARRAGLNRVDAEDCGQYTWVSLYCYRHRIRDPQSIPAWLIRTTRRRAIQIGRQIRVTKFTDLQPDDLVSENLPEETLLALERQVMIELAMAELGPRCQRLLHLLFFASETSSYQEIAAALEVAPNSLGPIRSRCLARLRKKLEELDFPLD